MSLYKYGISDKTMGAMQNSDPEVQQMLENAQQNNQTQPPASNGIMDIIKELFGFGDAQSSDLGEIANLGKTVSTQSAKEPLYKVSTMYDQIYSDPFNIKPRNSEIIIGTDGKAKTIPILPMSSGEIMAGGIVPPDFNAERFQSIFPTTGIMQQAPLDMNRFQGVSDMSIIDETTNDEQSQEYIDQVKKSQGGGIGGLLKFLLGLAVPGAGLLMNLGQSGFNKLRGGFDKGLGSLRNLNQRIQGSNFGRATSLADYFDMRNYGGYQGRENARARTMAQARGIQKKIDTGEYRRTAADNVIDRGRGDRPGGANYSAPSRPSRTSPQSGMQAERTRSRDLGSMRGGVGR